MLCRVMATWALTWACSTELSRIPQIVAAICGGTVLSLVGSHQSDMMIVAGVLLIAGALSVGIIKGHE